MGVPPARVGTSTVSWQGRGLPKEEDIEDASYGDYKGAMGQRQPTNTKSIRNVRIRKPPMAMKRLANRERLPIQDEEGPRYEGNARYARRKGSGAVQRFRFSDSQFEESTMTTEEALAVAESVQFEGDHHTDRVHDRARGVAVGGKPQNFYRDVGRRQDSPGHHKGKRLLESRERQRMKRHWEDSEYTPPGSTDNQNYKDSYSAGRGKKRDVHIERVENIHFSDAQQFAEATKARYDAAERGAMRRAIYYANIHPAIKVALLQHSTAVQFSDAGDEIPSVPLSWIVRAARGILQFANTYGTGGHGIPGGKFSPYIDDVQDAPDLMEMARQHPHWPKYLARAEGDEESAMEEMFADVDWEGEEMPPYSDPLYLRNKRTWGSVPAQYKAGDKTLWAASSHWKHPEANYERIMGRPPPERQ